MRVVGGHFHERYAVADVDGPDHAAGNARFARDGPHDVARGDAHLAAHVQEQAHHAGLGPGARRGFFTAGHGITQFAAHQQLQQRGGHVHGGHVLVQERFHDVGVLFQLARLDVAAHFGQQLVGLHRGHVAGGGHLVLHDVRLGELLDVAQLVEVAPGNEGERPAGTPGATGAADAVHVVFHGVGDVVVDHGLHVIHVDAARGHVGGHQDFDAVAAETRHHPVALRLVEVAVQAVGLVAAPLQVLGQFVHAALGRAEHDGALGVVQVQHPAQGLQLLEGPHLVVDLFDAGHGDLLLGHLEEFRRLQEALGHVQDGRGHGGRKEDGLRFLGHVAEDVFDVVAKAHVEHFVGFIQHGHAHRGKVDGAALHVVHDATGGAHDHLRASAQGLELAVDGLAAVHGQHVQAALARGKLGQFFGHLDGQFTRGAQDDALDVLFARVDAFQQGNAEGGRLAGAGLGLADDVAAFEDVGDGQGLDGRGFFKAHLFDGLQDFLGKGQFFKA